MSNDDWVFFNNLDWLYNPCTVGINSTVGPLLLLKSFKINLETNTEVFDCSVCVFILLFHLWLFPLHPRKSQKPPDSFHCAWTNMESCLWIFVWQFLPSYHPQIRMIFNHYWQHFKVRQKHITYLPLHCKYI